ncbi:hypothetical protein EGR_06562 [Echinococcus granulosus]|uniref:Uncharacterized protein n=1 Tax=Echinococcus granulosus TaxID=6210 RepID=W6UBT2_ECHGR|nr:hypothetical protein EGR_06562 [Echinococcus granulosus]EUB58575.1 hypothetical protein EGR_06562 [Echinococcus granulosus]
MKQIILLKSCYYCEFLLKKLCKSYLTKMQNGKYWESRKYIKQKWCFRSRLWAWTSSMMCHFREVALSTRKRIIERKQKTENLKMLIFVHKSSLVPLNHSKNLLLLIFSELLTAAEIINNYYLQKKQKLRCFKKYKGYLDKNKKEKENVWECIFLYDAIDCRSYSSPQSCLKIQFLRIGPMILKKVKFKEKITSRRGINCAYSMNHVISEEQTTSKLTKIKHALLANIKHSNWEVHFLGKQENTCDHRHRLHRNGMDEEKAQLDFYFCLIYTHQQKGKRPTTVVVLFFGLGFHNRKITKRRTIAILEEQNFLDC